MYICGNNIWIDEKFTKGSIKIEDGRIVEIIPRKIEEAKDYGDNYIIPGLIDTHTHGYNGKSAADGDEEFIKEWAKYYPKEGVTTFLPGVNVTTEDKIKQSLVAIANAIDAKPEGAQIHGIFLQAPFMDHDYCGTYNRFLLKKPTVELFKDYMNCARGNIKTISIAPEDDEAHETLKYCVKEGIKVSLGFTRCSFEEAMKAFDEGASNVVHCFNCMAPLSSRDPHLPAAAILRDDVYTEVMADGIHVHPAVMEIVGKAKGKDKLISITDSSNLKGLKPGVYDTNRGKIRVCEDGVGRMASGKIAGSMKPMIENIKNLLELGNLPLVTAINAVTINPARMLGIDSQKGLIKEGYIADITVYDRNYNVIQTYVQGKEMF